MYTNTTESRLEKQSEFGLSPAFEQFSLTCLYLALISGDRFIQAPKNKL